MTVSVTTGTSGSPSCSDRYGVMTKARGTFDFFNSASLAGMAFSVERLYEGSALASGWLVKQACDVQSEPSLAHRKIERTPGGSLISGGALSSSLGCKGAPMRLSC